MRGVDCLAYDERWPDKAVGAEQAHAEYSCSDGHEKNVPKMEFPRRLDGDGILPEDETHGLDGNVTKTASIDITLKGVPQPTQTLELLPGWNLVTLTKQLKDKPDGVQKFLSLKPMTLDSEGGSIIMCNDATSVKAGSGYWIYSKISQSVELVQDTETPVSQVELKPQQHHSQRRNRNIFLHGDVERWCNDRRDGVMEPFLHTIRHC